MKDDEIVQAIIDAMKEKKAKKIAVIDLRNVEGAICKYHVVCEGDVPTQVGAIGMYIMRNLRELFQLKSLGHIGIEASQWVVVDYGSVLAHVFLPSIREFYKLEQLWHDAPIVWVKDEDE